jgi:hypothetical protein
MFSLFEVSTDQMDCLYESVLSRMSHRDLYIQAMIAFQAVPESDENSYFQIMGKY